MAAVRQAGGTASIRRIRLCEISQDTILAQCDGVFVEQRPNLRMRATHASSMSSIDPTGSPSTRTNGNSFFPPFFRFHSFLASSSPATCGSF